MSKKKTGAKAPVFFSISPITDGKSLPRNCLSTATNVFLWREKIRKQKNEDR
ncbi:hypothetical protein [Vibrio diazotrophicus]|uniref:hypothetical protein n=1 Tax=Vibrio diazotrophicus TaxID=685 RepID=UPI0015E0CC9A|nr:hypothetical protein [Vibrio diazotrophicus]